MQAIHLINDAYTDTSTNTAAEMLGTGPEASVTVDDHDPRQRIDSLNTHNQQHIARSSSFVSENGDIRRRMESVGTGSASRSSFIKGQEKVSY